MADDGYTDDLTIPDEADLWRRIHPSHIVFDENVGQSRPSSAAFDDSSDGTPMSVLLGQEAGPPENALVDYQGYALASFTVGLARACGQGIARDPTSDQPAHVLVFGRKTKSVKRRLTEGSQWVIRPPNS